MAPTSHGTNLDVAPANFFDVEVGDVGRLSPSAAVDLLRALLWAEASRLGLAKNLINVPTAINVADGGVDGDIRDAVVPSGDGLIKSGVTRYQVKTGAFSLSGDSDVKQILLRDSSRHEPNPGSEDLQPRVRSCFERDGTLVVVLFGYDNPDREEDGAIGFFRDFLTRVAPEFADASVEVWRQNQIIAFLKRYPSLALIANRRQLGNGHTHFGWSRLGQLTVHYQAGPTQTEAIEGLRRALRTDTSEALHIRLCGDAGIGKTRIALEATASPDIEHLVLYFERATDFLASPLRGELLRDDNDFWVVLVIDECSGNDRTFIWQSLNRIGPRLKLITIYNDTDQVDLSYAYFEPPPLEPEQIASILSSYGVPAEAATRWSAFCGGSPRVAHVLGANLQNNPEDLLRPGPLENVWERYVVGYDDPNAPHVKDRRRVLLYLGLFKRFGFEKFVAGEGDEIQRIIARDDSRITSAYFREAVAELRSRKILQGDATLYITPKLLHIWLWSQWWKTYSSGFPAGDFFRSLSPTLQGSFADMLVYAEASAAAQDVVKSLLGPSGPFHEADFLKTRRGAAFFLRLTEANPTAALRCLENTIGRWTREEVANFTEGRREIIHSLEKIAVWRDLFCGAVRLLLLLAAEENETWANNATGVFAEMFSNGTGRVAPTESPPAERLGVLREAISSTSAEERTVAFRAIRVALKVQGISRILGTEHQGLTRDAKLWVPKDRFEHVDAYRQLWLLLRESLATLPEEERSTGVSIVLESAWDLLFVEELSDLVLDTIEEISRRQWCKPAFLIKRISTILQYRKPQLSAHLAKRLTAIRSSLLGTGFPARLRLYAGTNVLDRAPGEDTKIELALNKLAEKAVQDRAPLKSNLAWLVTKEAENGSAFGQALAKRDVEFSFLNDILDAARSAGPDATSFFIGGYLRELSLKNPLLLQDTLERVSSDEKLVHLLVELTWRVGATDASVMRLIRLAREHKINPLELRLLAFGRTVNALSASVFGEIVDLLLSLDSPNGAAALLDLFAFYYLHDKEKKQLPEDTGFWVLSQPALFRSGECPPNTSLDYHWAEVAMSFLRQYPKRSRDIAALLFDHFADSDTPLNAYSTEVHKVLDVALELDPNTIWELCQEVLEDSDSSKSFYVSKWIGGSLATQQTDGPIKKISMDRIWKWIDAKPNERARFFATLLPHDLMSENWEGSLTRAFLVRYGNKPEVRSSLIANYLTGGWSGPASSHYSAQKERLLTFRPEEDNEFVKRFIDELVEALNSLIERAVIEEERQRF
jgi:hypothetical protein